jgi:hypothetical protein
MAPHLFEHLQIFWCVVSVYLTKQVSNGFGFEVSQTLNAVATLDASLNIARLASSKVQRAYQLGVFGNRSQILFEPLGYELASSIVALNEVYHQIWVAFENGGYIGYYQPEPFSVKFEDNEYGVAIQSDFNASCPTYSFTHSDWLESGQIGPNPGENTTSPLDHYCLEYFSMSDENGLYNGRGSKSYGAHLFDATKEEWYEAVKDTHEKQWVALVDRLVEEPALAICLPLNNRSFDGSLADARGLMGVTCTGVFIRELCEKLDNSIDNKKSFAYIRDRNDGRVVAASVNDTTKIFNYATNERFNVTHVPIDLIQWSAPLIGEPDYDDSITRIIHDTTGEVGYKSFFVNVVPYNEGESLNWDVVILQRVDCPKAYEVTHDNQTCVACVSPLTSSGGNTQCDQCIPNYYKLSSWTHCKICPAGATCAGGYGLPINIAGYWSDNSKLDGSYLTAAYQCQTISGQSCLVDYKCLTGFTGRQCSYPQDGYMFLGVYSIQCGYVGSWNVGIGMQSVLVYLFLLLFMFVANCKCIREM